MSEDKDGLPFGNTEPEVPAGLWADSQPMTLADLAAAYERLRDSPPVFRERPVVLVSPQEVRAIESTLRAMDARINGVPEPQTFTAIESTFATPPQFVPRLMPASEPARERVEIDTSVAYEPQRYPSVAGQWRAIVERVMDTTVEEMIGEAGWGDLYDSFRTRVEPGADPRRGWAMRVDERDARASMVPVYEVDRTDGLHAFYSNLGYTLADAGYLLDQARYVPRDVCRWRDPAHRNELTRRAREYAECAQRLVDR